MPAFVVIGGQWGDEGKGRMVDLLAQDAAIIARYSAGDNAGHTIINHMGKFALHLVPAGIFYPDKVCLIGNGVVINPAVLLDEIHQLEERGVSTKNLFVSDRAQVLFPYHQMLDELEERARGDAALGTTKRGVGPAFVDKIARRGIRMADLLEPDALRARLEQVLPEKNAVLVKLYDAEPLDFEELFDAFVKFGCELKPYVRDTSTIVHDALDKGEQVLLEGAQGSLLDVDAGTYPFVTSSAPSPLAAGAPVGIGIGPTQIERVVGVYKAYMTRVGAGPMPTELDDETGDILRREGPAPEFGATTGRPRRCGWFDGVASRYSVRVNGVTGAALTRLDVLDNFPAIEVCTAYELDGKQINSFPPTMTQLSRVTPVFEEHKGWQAETANVRKFSDLPKQAQSYVERIEELLGCPIEMVSVGPEREQIIIR
ncbi:MAG: adenylosuccinate synthase [Chloroflexi bacterium]|nr:adenylosuccinate synthase [Chloroflexota bacterium]MCI0889315.1 adenylosuccinate synthase [Chloroflexota bacterium]